MNTTPNYYVFVLQEHAPIPELLDNWLLKLPEVLEQQAALEAEYPFNLIAGERRTYNANAAIHTFVH